MPFELTIVFLLILLNGFFALSEMAVMTARKSRLRQLGAQSRGARVALELAERPERFLSSVQVWITLIGILTGYFGGESIAMALRDELARIPWVAKHAEPISIGVSVTLILFVSVVVGELVPKRLAIVRPEKVARAVAIPMRVLATAAAPAVSLLSVTTEALFKLFPVKRGNDSEVTEEEIKISNHQSLPSRW